MHNFFPVLSPAVHEALSARGVPVVQTLHNYRLVCANGNLLREGRVCEECVPRGPWHAVRYGCYRGSRAQTLVWADAIAHHRARDTWRRCVDRFVAPTAFAARKLVAAGLPPERVEVLPYVLADPGEPAPPGRGAVFVGRLAPEKGVDLLIDAWREQRGAPLAIVGSGPAEAALRERARGVPGVRFLGALSRDGVAARAARGRVRGRAFALVRDLAVRGDRGARVRAAGGGVARRRARGARGRRPRRACTSMRSSPRASRAHARACSADAELVRRLAASAREDYLERHAPEAGLAARERIYAAVRDERRARGPS